MGNPYSICKARLHTGEAVQFVEDSAPPPPGKRVRAISVRGICGSLICDHLNITSMTAIRPHRRRRIPAAASKETMTRLEELDGGQIPPTGRGVPILMTKNENWGDMAVDNIAETL